jgi:hypothetical protein
MDRLRGMNVRTLLNTRIDLSSLRAPPFSPYTCSTPTVECVDTPDLSPTFSTPDLFESPCSTPPSASPHIPSFSLPPPVVQPEDFCATIRTMDGREINADLIVRSLQVLIDRWRLRSRSSSVQARPTTPRSWRRCRPTQSTARTGRRCMLCLLSNLGRRRIMERSGSPSTHTFSSSGMPPTLSGP